MDDEVKSPKFSKTWADIFKNVSDEEEPLEVEFQQRDFSSLVSIKDAATSCCYHLDFATPEQAKWLLHHAPYIESIECVMNSIREYVNYSNKNFSVFEDNVRLNLLDSFMRARHDILSSWLAKCLGEDYSKTDIKFNEMFPISSERTPDFIFKNAESYVVIEVTAVSDPERAYKKKGHQGKGYESKYERELEQIKALGINVHYIVIVFDISDAENCDHVFDIEKAVKLLDIIQKDDLISDLNFLRKELITSTSVLFENYSRYLGILYGSPYSLAVHSNVESVPIFGRPIEPYNGTYKRVGVSNYIFDKVVSVTPRLLTMINKLPSTSNVEITYVLVFEQLNSHFKYKKSKMGAKLREWEFYVQNNNYSWICTNLSVELKGEKVNVPKADFEFMSYEKNSTRNLNENLIILQPYNPDHLKQPAVNEMPLTDFKNKVETMKKMSLECKYENQNLEDKIIKSILKMDRNVNDQKTFSKMMSNRRVKPLCHYQVNEKAFENALTVFNDRMDKSNGTGGEVPILQHVKPPFLYPVAQIQKSDYIDYRKKPSVLNFLKDIKIGDYTDKVIAVANSESFQFGSTNSELNVEYEQAKLKLSTYHKEILSQLKDFKKESNMNSFPRLKDLPNSETHHLVLRDLNDRLKKVAEKNGIVNKNIGLVTMGRGKKTQSGLDFIKEMSHFRSKESKSHLKGVGMTANFQTVDSLMQLLKCALLSPSDTACNEPLYDEFVSADAKLLKQLKTDMIDSNKSYYEHLRSTNLYHSCAFISRMCHTLMFHSQSSINSSKVVVDNLGYDKVIMLIKGGKKIFTTKKSKLFRLIFPTFNSCSDLYQSNTLSSNFKVVVVDERTYLITPWMNMHETLVADGITFLYRTMGFAMLNKQPGIDNEDNLDRVYFNIILAMHNRRQTESMLHSLRYIFMNCMSEVSAIEEILAELAGFNYDFFQFWIRQIIGREFKNFALKLNALHTNAKAQKVVGLDGLGLHHPFNKHKITDYNTLALGIYSSYLMSKAPTTQILEQVRNMKSIMETHDEFLKEVKLVENCFICFNGEFVEYYDSLARSDFNFDPSYCVLLGKFMGDYLLNMEKRSRLIQKWDNVIERPWDEMSNTKGLRGKSDDFFGNKGYYIVYKEVLNDKEAIEGLMSVLTSDATGFEKEKAVNAANETYRSRIAKTKLEGVVFHVVDKVQRGGSREIYVMDMETKVHQQVIEEYTKYLCKLVPNEMISIPSNKRLSTIHSRVFEGGRDNAEKYYWVLDCRKWAPKSLVEKFMLFLMGAKHALPDTFVVHALNFFTMMLGKRVYTRPKVVDILTKSKINEKFKHYFKEDTDKKAYYFDMPYSWVMGIFNYFSSLVHVANQMHASHIIRITAQLSFSSENILHMVAHSDDSAGKIIVNNTYEMYRASFIYETLMHSANHLLSKKKCNQGKVYYEFLSILYIGGTLLSLLSKFTGIFNYHPTDKGYCVDITDAYSKSTELLLNGGTFEQSYIAMKIQAMLIYRFYFGANMPKLHYELPPAMFGIPDAHPLMALLCGSDADLFRIFKTGDDVVRKMIISINNQLLPFETETMGLLKAFQCTPKVFANKKLLKLKEKMEIPKEFSDSWTLKNVKFNNTKLNTIQFLMKLNDKSFVAALQDENLTRRLSRSYYFRSHITVHTSFGDMKPKDIKELLFLIKRTLSGEVCDLKPFVRDVISQIDIETEFQDNVEIMDKIFGFLYCEISRLYDYMDKVHYNPDAIIDNFKTCKPVYISVQKTIEECPVNYSPQSLCSWIKEPDFRSLLPDTRGYITAQHFVEKSLKAFDLNIDELTSEQLCTILQKVKQKSKSEFFCYSNLPWDLREVNTYQDVLNYLSHNTFPNKMIRGLAIQFSKTIGTPLENITADLKDHDLQISLTYFVLANALMSSPDFEEIMLSLDFKAPLLIGGGVLTLKKLLLDLISYWKKQPTVHHYLECIMVCVAEQIAGNKYFSSEKIKHTYFHSFIKRQFLVDNVWLGQGKLYISLSNLQVVFTIVNIKINQVLVQTYDSVLTESQVAYINICLGSAQLPKLQESMSNTEVEDWGLLGLCYDKQGNYYIGDVQGSLRHIPANFDLNLGTPLSSIEKGMIKSFKGSKLIWDSVLDEQKHTYYISTLPVETQNAALLLRGTMLDNLHNKRILSDKDSNAVSVLIEMCAKELDLEQNIPAEHIVKNYSLSEIYKVFHECKRLNLCTVLKPELKVSNFPASDGGLLNMFIKYSISNPKFDFKWQRYISPEYMALKSSQPESFVTEVVNTVKNKYNSLYTDIDKESLHRSLLRLGGASQKVNMEMELMSLLCTWGYTGVAGALEELGGESKIANFNKLRCYSPEAAYSGFFSELFVDLFIPLMKIYKKGLSYDNFNPVSAFGCNIPVNVQNINYYIMDVMHVTVLATYYENSRDSWVYEEQQELLQCMVSSVLSNAATCEMFSAIVKNNVVTRNLPVNVKAISEWRMAVRTLRECYIKTHSKGHELDYNIRRDLSSSTINPYVITKDNLAKHGVKMKSMRLFHYGAISVHLYNLLGLNFTEDYKGEKLWFKVHMVSMEELKATTMISYNYKAFPIKRFSEDFLEGDEYDEIRIEYQSDTPDIEFIDSMISEYQENNDTSPYVENEKRFVSIVINGKLTKVLKVDLKIVTLIGGSLNLENLSYLRMLGDDIIVITNCVNIRLLSNPQVKIFKNRGTAWSGHSIINPRAIYYNVISRDIDDISFWAKVLDAEYISNTNIRSKISNDYMMIRNQRGVIQNENELMDPSVLWGLIDENMKARQKQEEMEKLEEEELKKVGGLKKEVERNVNKFKDEGLDEEQILKYKEIVNMAEKKDGWSVVFDILEKMSNEEKKKFQTGKIEEVMENIISKPKTALQHELIMQVPIVFGGGRDRGKPKKNNLFRERRIIAELEAVCPGLIWKVLSGTLHISQATYDMFKDQIEIYKMMAKCSKKHKQGKQFIVNLCMLILNDAVVIKNPENENDTWRVLTAATLKLMLLDEDKIEDDDWDFASEDPDQGNLKYGISGERDIL